MSNDQIKLLRDQIPEMPIVVLAKPLDMNGNMIALQDYVVNGENVIPLFGSESALAESLGGGNLERSLMAIDRSLLAELICGSEVFLFNPQLPSQMRFTAAEFRAAFPEPFVWPSIERSGDA